MRTFFISFALLFAFCAVKAQDAWLWQNPLPQGNHLNDVVVVDENKMIAVGNGGTILTTTDRGESWDIDYYEDIGTQLYSVDFIDASTGWICGTRDALTDSTKGIILKTSDGGQTWTSPAFIDGYYLSKLKFWDNNNGWAVGYSYSGATHRTFYFSTNDGFKNWTISELPTYNNKPVDAQFINPNIGWISAWNGLWKTVDGGVNWDSLGPGYDGIHFIDADTGWAVSFDYYAGCIFTIYKTVDGGVTWQENHSGSGMAKKIYFKDSQSGWVLDSEIFQTNNGGETWDSVGSAGYANSIDISKNGLGFMVGGYGSVIRTEDGGNSWDNISKIVTTDQLFSVHFISDKIGWAAGGGHSYSGGDELDRYPIVLKTTDGGLKWENAVTGIGEHEILDIHFTDEHTGWATGRDKLYSSKDGGQNWHMVPIPEIGWSPSLFFLNFDTGWVAGNSSYANGIKGIIRKTTDGGNNWQEFILEKEDSGIEDIHFINKHQGWAVGRHGTVLKTDDGGDTWNSVALAGINTHLSCMFFDEKGNGWIAGTFNNYPDTIYNVILRTSDDGDSWSSSTISGNAYFKSIWFLDEQTGFGAVNSNDISSLFMTQDSGVTWSMQVPDICPQSIFFVDNKAHSQSFLSITKPVGLLEMEAPF
jgi:photosystem II stability/assembly factor-like uncharacterized protein